MNSTVLLRSKILATGVARVSAAPVAVRRMSKSCLRALSLSPPFLQGKPSVAASSRRCFSSASETLSEILARELAEEVDGGRKDMPDDLAELKSTIEDDWKVVDDGAATRLYRSVGGSSKVVVSFHCQDTVDDPEGALETHEDDDEEPAVPFRFDILVSKAGNTLVLSCMSQAGVTEVFGMAMSSEDAEAILANGIGRNQYQGPEFAELDEDLRDALQEYVFSDLGVNDDVSAFVSMYADYKEQLEYIGFLKSVGKVL